MVNLLDLGRFVRNMILAVPYLSPVFPGGVPEPIHDVHVLVRDLIPLIVRD